VEPALHAAGSATSAERIHTDGLYLIVTALKAHVMNGRIVVDEPVDLPEGAELRVSLYDAAADAMSSEERAALEKALERSLQQADADDLIDADDVLAELQRP
jgi:hypothetical protein